MKSLKKMAGILKAAFLAGMILYPSAGNAAVVEIEIREPETTYHALPKNIGKKGAALAFEADETLGLAVSEAFYTLAIYENRIRIDMGHTKHRIFLQNSLKRNVCLYEEAKAHEENHIRISKTAMAGFKEKVEKEVGRMVLIGQKETEIAAYLKDSFSRFEKEVKDAQLDFDRKDYERIMKACP